MKLNNQQVTVLAKTVLEKLDKKEKYTQEEKEVAKKYIKEYNKIQKEHDELNKKENKLVNITEGNLGYSINHCSWSSSHSVEDILKYKPNTEPSIEEIKNKIILESIFETKESLQEFIDNLVKEYSK